MIVISDEAFRNIGYVGYVLLGIAVLVGLVVWIASKDRK